MLALFIFMSLQLKSPCKINLLLNILGKRSDGFHELETIMQPVPFHDRLSFVLKGKGIQFTCSDPSLPTDSKNLVYQAAAAFFRRFNIPEGVQIHLEKNIPPAAGLGGGSGNAAITLVGLNQLFGFPASSQDLFQIAAGLGSDIPFFLQESPALATGRGEKIESVEFFPALRGVYILLVHPGFGISTPWSYQQLSRFPEALNGKAGRASNLISLLQSGDLKCAATQFYNSLEAPALNKYPLLVVIQDFFRENGATVALMSGSGSAIFALLPDHFSAEKLRGKFRAAFGEEFWTRVVPLSEKSA
ncbi:MAG: 4-(cytidine 5'-diphospho)-2-C-methyl-D-erythritol kinase [Verrucomicrobiota bacterium]